MYFELNLGFLVEAVLGQLMVLYHLQQELVLVRAELVQRRAETHQGLVLVAVFDQMDWLVAL